MAREADCFALFAAQRQTGRVEMLVRVKHLNRWLVSGERLVKRWAGVKPPREIRLHLRRLSKRKKTKGRRQRTAPVEIRFDRVTMRAQCKGRPPLSMYGVRVTEPNPPDDVEPIHGYLLTRITVKTVDDALSVVSSYVCRWRVEEFFRVLKHGCKVERLSLRTVARLSRAIALYRVIAWRVMLLTLLGREAPDLPAAVFFIEAGDSFFGALLRPEVSASTTCNADRRRTCGGLLGGG